MERATVNLAHALSSKSLDVTFVAILKNKHFFKLNPYIKFIEPSDFNEVNISIVKSIIWLRKLVISEQPKTVLIYNKFFGALVSFALLGTSFRVIVSERSSPLYKWPIKIRLFNYLSFRLKKIDGVIAQTKLAASYQKMYYGSNVSISVIPNIVRDVKVYPNRTRQKVILAVGRLDEYIKGFDRLIMAFAKISRPDWSLWLAGRDDNALELRSLIEKFNISDKVHFKGPTVDIDSLYASASIFVIPSRSEGFPNVLCEAMAAGLACISFNFVAGPIDIIRNNYDGILVEDGNIIELTNNINYLIDNESERLRLGQNAYQNRHRFSKNNITSKYLNFILS